MVKILDCDPEDLSSILNSHPKWSIRLMVRTPGFQPGDKGSIPLWTTKNAPVEEMVYSPVLETGFCRFESHPEYKYKFHIFTPLYSVYLNKNKY